MFGCCGNRNHADNQNIYNFLYILANANAQTHVINIKGGYFTCRNLCNIRSSAINTLLAKWSDRQNDKPEKRAAQLRVGVKSSWTKTWKQNPHQPLRMFSDMCVTVNDAPSPQTTRPTALIPNTVHCMTATHLVHQLHKCRARDV